MSGIEILIGAGVVAVAARMWKRRRDLRRLRSRRRLHRRFDKEVIGKPAQNRVDFPVAPVRRMAA